MDKKNVSKRSRSTACLKTEISLAKQLEKVARMSFSPISKKHHSKTSLSPKNSTLHRSKKNFEITLHKSQIFESKDTSPGTSRPSRRTRLKVPSKELLSKKTKTISELPIWKLLESTVKGSGSPIGSAKRMKPSPPRTILPKQSLLFMPQPGQSKCHQRKFIKTVSHLSSHSITGSVNGKPKPQNQDSYIMIPNFRKHKDQTLLAVMDGHGVFGHEVSTAVKGALPVFLSKNLSKERSPSGSPTPEDTVNKLKRALISSYRDTIKSLCNKKAIDISYSGTTAVSVLIREDICVCANVGDSRALIGRYEDFWTFVEISHDHKPGIPEERQRIEASGGRVAPFKDIYGQYMGPDRVWLKNEDYPGLAMSRSIGDLVAASVGVSAEPEILSYRLTQADKFIVLASDGVWEFISSQTCVDIVSQYYERNDPNKAAQVLADEAFEIWKKDEGVIDDITVIVAFLTSCNSNS